MLSTSKETQKKSFKLLSLKISNKYNNGSISTNAHSNFSHDEKSPFLDHLLKGNDKFLYESEKEKICAILEP